MPTPPPRRPEQNPSRESLILNYVSVSATTIVILPRNSRLTGFLVFCRRMPADSAAKHYYVHAFHVAASATSIFRAQSLRKRLGIAPPARHALRSFTCSAPFTSHLLQQLRCRWRLRMTRVRAAARRTASLLNTVRLMRLTCEHMAESV